MKPKLLCIVGKTASGKDCIVKGAIEKLSQYNIREICSYADRPMRDGEVDGIGHYFITTEEFDKLKEERKNDILAYTRIGDNGYQYMALTDELEKSHIYIIDYIGLKNLKELHGDSVDIVTVYIHASTISRLQRAEATRSDFHTEFKKRVKNEEAQFKEFTSLKLYDYKINNTDGKLDKSINKLCNIITTELINSNNSNKLVIKE